MKCTKDSLLSMQDRAFTILPRTDLTVYVPGMKVLVKIKRDGQNGEQCRILVDGGASQYCVHTIHKSCAFTKILFILILL